MLKKMSTKCPNKTSPEWIRLTQELGEINAYKVFLDYNQQVPPMDIVDEYIKSYKSIPNQVNYSLKAVELLSTPKAEEVFAKGEKNNWDLNKILTELQVPKEQKQIILDKNITKESIKDKYDFVRQLEGSENQPTPSLREEIITSLLADNSFVVEINTTKTLSTSSYDPTQVLFLRGEKVLYKGNKYVIDNIKDGGLFYDIIPVNSEENGVMLHPLDNISVRDLSAISGTSGSPTSYYSNLTVPGGTNYTENEIATPDITPNIKGHAQFSTENGIGWFRSDESDGKSVNKSIVKNISEVPDEFIFSGEKVYKEFGEWYYGSQSISDESALFKYNQSQGLINNETPIKTNIRRILEVQSDLFQKGRDKDKIINWQEVAYNKGDVRAKQANDFLQLLNKKNNWVTFFVKSIIQDSAKKGYEKVLFPKGDTASKIEGHSTLEEFKKQKEDRIKELENKLNNQRELEAEVMQDMMEAQRDEYLELDADKQLQEVKNGINNEIKQLKQELKRVETEGFGALKPIYDFYENRVSNILNKLYDVKEVTDEYGNKWNEITIDNARDLNPIQLSKDSIWKEKATLDKMYNAKKVVLNGKSYNFFPPNNLKPLRDGIKARNKRHSEQFLQLRLTEDGNHAYIVVRDKNKGMDSLNKVYERDSGVPFEANLSQYQNYSELETETVNEAMKKVEVLKKVFNVDVVLDTTIEASGQLEIVNGKPLIKLNPNYLFTDTVIHEFGHLYIDLLGGLDNIRIRAAVNKLKNTKIWEEVSKEYPELNSNMLAKEVLATAIGREGASIFNSSFENSWWSRFKEWLFDRISNLFGIDNTTAKKLATEMITNNVVIENVKLSDSIQKRKIKNKDLYKSLDSIDKIRKEAINRIDIKVNRWKSEDDNKRKKFVSLLENLKKQMENYAQIDNANSMINIVNFITKQYDDIVKTLNKEDIDAKTFNQLDAFKHAYDLVKNINYVMQSKPSEFNMLSPEEFEAFKDTVINLVAKEDFINKEFETKSLDVMAKKLAKYSTRGKSKVRRQLEKEWIEQYQDSTAKKDRAKEKDKYIKEGLQRKKDEIAKENYLYFKGTLQRGTDISMWSSKIMDSGQVNSEIIHVVQKMLDKADYISTGNFLSTRDSLYDTFKKYMETHSGLDQKQRYKNIINITDENDYLVSEYSPKYYEEKQELIIRRSNILEEFGKDSDKYKEVNKEYKQWVKENSQTMFISSTEIAGFIDRIFNNYNDFKGKTRSILDLYLSDYSDRLKKNEQLSDADRSKIVNMFTANTASGNLLLSIPNSSWKDSKFSSLTPVEKETLKTLKAQIKKDDNKLLYSYSKLAIKFDGAEFYKLPQINKSVAQRIFENGFGQVIKETVKDKLQIRNEDTQFGSREEESIENGLVSVFANEKNEEAYGVPIYYRSKLSKDERSHDVFSILLANSWMSENFSEKISVSADTELLSNILVDKEYLKSNNGLYKVNRLFGKKEDNEEYILANTQNEYNMLRSIIEDRVYGISEIPHELMGVSLNKVAGMLNGWASSTMLMVNYFAAVPNVLMGTAMNITEAVGGNIYNTNDLRKAHSYYWKDLGSSIGDVGSIRPSSLTNLLLERLEILDEGGHIDTKFIDNNRFRALMKRNTLFFLNHSGEHYMQSVMMYAILHNKGYIDKVKLDSEGKLQIDLTEEQMLEVRQLIKKVIADNHGQYDSRMKNQLQREWMGKSVFMLRKWLVRGTSRRWRGLHKINKNFADFENDNESNIFYSEESGEFEEGNYVTTLRFLNNVRKSLFNIGSEISGHKFNKLTDYEKSNIRKTLVEVSFMVLSYAAYALLDSMGDDEPDKDTKQLIYMNAYFFRRVYAELMFYSNPPEGLKVLRTPAASLSFIEKIGKAIGQLVLWEKYERSTGDYEKGDYKLQKRLEDITPLASQFDRWQTADESLSYLTNLY